MHVFQIVFSVFSLIRVSAPKLGPSGSQVSDVVAVGACWVRVVISFGASNSSLGRVWVTVGWGQWVSGRRCEIGEMLWSVRRTSQDRSKNVWAIQPQRECCLPCLWEENAGSKLQEPFDWPPQRRKSLWFKRENAGTSTSILCSS